MVALASSEARAAAFFARFGAGALASAISTSRRTASDSRGLSCCSFAQASIALRNSGEARSPIIGVVPVLGRPRPCFCLADIDLKQNENLESRL